MIAQRGIFLACVLGLMTLPGAALALHRYSIDVSPDLVHLLVEACFDSPVPTRLRATAANAPRYIGQLASKTPAGRGDDLRLTGKTIRIRGLGPDRCLVYRVDLGAAVAQNLRRGYDALRVGDDLLTVVGAWLWRPSAGDLEIRFATPPGIRVSAPWKLIEQADGWRVFRPAATPDSWRARVAFGSFGERSLEVPGGQLRMAVLNPGDAAEVIRMSAWLGEAARAVAGVYGRFPRDRAQLMVIPTARGDEPVPWAHVLRGGGPAAHFFVNPGFDLAAFREDWTAAHELSHLLLPHVTRSDAWLSEGLASYYQNVLRARAGMMSDRLAWQKLFEGFERGMQSGGGRTLRYATRNMRGALMRVYWSGAALVLMADVEIRRQTQGRHSMDTALAALGPCCLEATRSYRAVEIARLLDEATGTRVWRDLLARYVDSTRFPDFMPVFTALGIEIEQGQVALMPEAPLVAIRESLTSRRLTHAAIDVSGN